MILCLERAHLDHDRALKCKHLSDLKPAETIQQKTVNFLFVRWLPVLTEYCFCSVRDMTRTLSWNLKLDFWSILFVNPGTVEVWKVNFLMWHSESSLFILYDSVESYLASFALYSDVSYRMIAARCNRIQNLYSMKLLGW